jgi:hypothetical protein
MEYLKYSNESRTGKEKNQQIKLSMYPPSIPTKFHTIHFKDNEQLAFNSTSRKFNNQGHDLPGPGYYARAAEKLENVYCNASISKKGFGVGFVSMVGFLLTDI